MSLLGGAGWDTAADKGTAESAVSTVAQMNCLRFKIVSDVIGLRP